MDDNQVHLPTVGTTWLPFGDNVRPMLSVSAILDELRIHRPLRRGSSRGIYRTIQKQNLKYQ
ncbi:MAG: hypothetical protein R6U96_03920 [Promethearchaeia archaeon]